MTSDGTAMWWSIALLVTVVGALFSGYPVALCLAGGSLLVAWLAAFAGAFDLSLLWAIPQRLFAIINNDLLIAVPLFIFMGILLERAQVAAALLTTLSHAFGTRRGGLSYAVLLVGALLAASTGIVGATVVMLTVLALPALLNNGYNARLASGLVCASGTLGQLIPPSIVLVLLGDQLASAYQQSQFEKGNFSPNAVSVNDLFAAALIPGLCLVVLYLIYLFIMSRVSGDIEPIPTSTPAISDESSTTTPTTPSELVQALFAPLFLIIAVLGSILLGIASPTEAAALGALGAVLIAAASIPARGQWLIVWSVPALLVLMILGLTDSISIHTQPDTLPVTLLLVIAMLLSAFTLLGIGLSLWRIFSYDCQMPTMRLRQRSASTLAQTVQQTVFVTCMIFFVVIGASVFSLVLRGLGGDDLIRQLLTDVPGGPVTLLIGTMVVMFVLGFILDFIEIVYVVIPVVLPTLLSIEIEPGVSFDPLWLGVLIAMNLQTSFLTPPFGFALFYLRGAAPPQVAMTDIYRGVIPFVAIQIMMLFILWWLPGLTTWLPELLANR